MGDFEHIEVERETNVATIWLNRPDKLNAMSADMWSDLPRAMEQLDAADDVRAVIVAGRGGSFSVGIDVAMLAALAPAGPSPAAVSRRLFEKIREMQWTASVFADCATPVIAAVDGYCLGAGMDIISACDIRLCSSRATFSIRETRMGLVADIGSLQRLPAIIGAGNVAELALTGDDIDATRAEQIGLVSRVLPDPDTLMKEAMSIAERIAANSPLVVSGVKRVLAANSGRSVDEALEMVAHWNAAYLLSSDLFEATTAFMEKRAPDFKGE